MRQAIETARVQVEQARTEADAPAGSLDETAHHPRSAREGDQRRDGEPNRRSRNANTPPTRRRAASNRSGRASRTPGTTSARSASNRQSRASSRAATFRKAKRRWIGTMNNAGTVLLTLADMSVIQAEVEVDETNIPTVQFRDRRRRSPLTPFPTGPSRDTAHRDREQPDSGGYRGRRRQYHASNELQGRGGARRGGARRPARLHRHGRGVRHGDAQAGRRGAHSAVAVRELIYDASGRIVKEPPEDKRRAPPETPAVIVELQPQGQTRKETEGVFVLRNGRAEFVPWSAPPRRRRA